VIQEMVDPDSTPDAQSLVKDPLLPPTKPGLGVEVDEAACARRQPDFSTGRAGAMARRYYGAFHADGGVADS
jgi:hypothetical protein